MSQKEGQTGSGGAWPGARRLAFMALRVLGHLAAPVVIAATAAGWMFDAARFELALGAVEQGYLRDELGFALLVQLGLAACVWALICIGWALWRQRRQQTRQLRVVRSSGGSVMVETLIVLPVILLLFFGLVQMTILNMAGALTNLAAFGASRAVWLWDSESDRTQMTDDAILERARIQAAAIVTPVASGSYVGLFGDLDFPVSRQARGMFVASQSLTIGGDMGVAGMERADSIASAAASADETSFFYAIDPTSFVERSVRKFTVAYHSTEVTLGSDAPEGGIVTEVVYKHLCVLPLVHRIFGSQSFDGLGEGPFVHIRRRFVRAENLRATAGWPRSSRWTHGMEVHSLSGWW